MSDNAEPSKNPADDGTLAGTLRTVIRKHMQSVDGMLPAQVLEYDRARNVATVRALVTVLTTSGESIQRASVAEVPVVALGGGGFVVNFPLKAGDMGWIEASDRDISLFTQGAKESPPGSLRFHSFEDGRFLPDAFRTYAIDASDEDRLVIQSLDGSTRIALGDGIVRVVTGGAVEVEAPLTKITGNVEVTGKIDVTGDVVAGGISLINHLTKGVTPGSGTSGPPQ